MPRCLQMSELVKSLGVGRGEPCRGPALALRCSPGLPGICDFMETPVGYAGAPVNGDPIRRVFMMQVCVSTPCRVPPCRDCWDCRARSREDCTQSKGGDSGRASGEPSVKWDNERPACRSRLWATVSAVSRRHLAPCSCKCPVKPGSEGCGCSSEPAWREGSSPSSSPTPVGPPL